jgi:uncharacterized membrane protein YedE/YeeE
MTCFENGTLNSPPGLLLAMLVGLAFGFWLERAGFGSSRKLTSIFYLRDFAVLKVMFTAIVTAAVGLYLLQTSGLVSAEAIYRPATYLWPQIVGGLVFGVGFVVGGYCPGTALVATVSAKGDALAFLGGVGMGSLVFAFTYPVLEDFVVAGARGVSTLTAALGLGPGTVTALVAVTALAAFGAASVVERSRSKRIRA